MWWEMPEILALGRPRQGGLYEPGASLGYMKSQSLQKPKHKKVWKRKHL